MAKKILQPNWIGKRQQAAIEIGQKPTPVRRAYLSGYANVYDGRTTYSSNLPGDKKAAPEIIAAYLSGVKDSTADGISSGNGIIDAHRLLCELGDRRVTQAIFDGIEIGYARLVGAPIATPQQAYTFVSTAAEQARRMPSYVTSIPHDMKWPALSPAMLEKAAAGLRKARTERRACGQFNLMECIWGMGLTQSFSGIIQPRDIGTLIVYSARHQHIGGLQFMHRYAGNCDDVMQTALPAVETAITTVTNTLLSSANHLGYNHHSTHCGEYRAHGRVAEVQRAVESRYDYKDAEAHLAGVGSRLFLVFSKLTGWCALPVGQRDLKAGIPLAVLEQESTVPAAYLPPKDTPHVNTSAATPEQLEQYQQLLAARYAQECERRQKLFVTLKEGLPKLYETRDRLVAG